MKVIMIAPAISPKSSMLLEDVDAIIWGKINLFTELETCLTCLHPYHKFLL